VAITLDEFLQNSIKRYQSKVESIDIETPTGELIPFTRPTTKQQLAYIDGIAKAVKIDGDGNYQGQDTALMLEVSKDYVFATCKFVQSKELQTALNVIDPLDIVVEIFEIQGTIELAGKINEAFAGDKLAEEVSADIKN
jgi:hypothetical protein